MTEKFNAIKNSKALKVEAPLQVEEEEFKEVNVFSDREPIEYEGDKSPDVMLRSSSIVQGSVLEVVAENGGEESPPLSPVESRSNATTS